MMTWQEKVKQDRILYFLKYGRRGDLLGNEVECIYRDSYSAVQESTVFLSQIKGLYHFAWLENRFGQIVRTFKN